MLRRIYHGSEKIIESPVFGKGNRRNDYGKGFYCTENKELAKEWACSRNHNGFANAYELEDTGLKILYLNQAPYTILHWMAILADNRTYWQRGSIAEQAKVYLAEQFLPSLDVYDVIIGYRADDSYFSFAQDFITGAISLRKLQKAMMLGKLGEQIVLRSERAFQRLQFKGAEAAQADMYFAKKAERDREARLDYSELCSDPDSIEDVFILDILRERMTADDPRLQ